MRSVVITGGGGFIGRNLAVRLRAMEGVEVTTLGRGETGAALDAGLERADTVFHLAGVNRPESPEEFTTGNVEVTRHLCEGIAAAGRAPRVVFASSIQAERDNPYGRSKREAEEVLAGCAAETGAAVTVFRLKNVFGKWCRPNYNSVVATFCHNIAHDLPIEISDPAAALELVHVDDVVDALIAEMDAPRAAEEVARAGDDIPSHTITLGELADTVRSFREMRSTLQVPDLSLRFNQQLYATYLSYLEAADWSYALEKRTDPRGDLAEFIKSPWFGQVFVSRTGPGITRGNHYHHTKTEKFLVIAGEAAIRFRHVEGGEVIEHRVRGEDYTVVDIPPGFTHSITNVGEGELITIFWASELFDPDRPDTCFLPVDAESGT
jgi:UDP-2-acetamido-2,6-beta-L-arabino-hexul-4-ose reductase